MDLRTLTDALKPIMRECIRDEVTQRIGDMEERVDKADEAIQGLKLLDPRIDKLEIKVQELKRRMDAVEARSNGEPPGNQSSKEFKPSFIEVKGFCTWDERREKGLSRAEVKRHFDEMKACLPEDLTEHFKESVPGGLFSYKIKVKVDSGHAYDIKATLNDIFQQGKCKIKGVKPYTVTERTPETQRKFATFGKAVEAVKLANREKTMEQEVVIEPRYMAIYVKPNNQQRPKIIAEVRRDGVLEWNDANCQELLGKSAKEIEATSGSRR